MNKNNKKDKGDREGWVHEVVAEYLFTKDDEGNPRATINGKHVYFVKKDWDYDWNKYPKELLYKHKPRDKYRFLGYCQDKYAFKILCKGMECGFVH